MISLLEEYGTDPRIELIQCAVGTEHGLREMIVMPDSTSTLAVIAGKNNGGILPRMWVPTLTIKDILTQFGAGFDFISIDVEGLSVDLALRPDPLHRPSRGVFVQAFRSDEAAVRENDAGGLRAAQEQPDERDLRD